MVEHLTVVYAVDNKQNFFFLKYASKMLKDSLLLVLLTLYPTRKSYV